MVSLALVKQHLRVDSTSEDTIIQHYLDTAIEYVEALTGKMLARGAATQTATGFIDGLQLLWGPDADLLTISYIDEDGNAQAVTDARILDEKVYAPEAGWPSRSELTPVTLSYTAGYATEPSRLTEAVMLLTGDYYRYRDTSRVDGPTMRAVEALCRQIQPVPI